MEASLRRRALFLCGSLFFPLLANGMGTLGRGLYLDRDSDGWIRMSGMWFGPALLFFVALPLLLPKLIRGEAKFWKENEADAQAIRLNNIVRAGVPLVILLSNCFDACKILTSISVPFLFKDLLVGAIAATIVCSLFVLREGTSR